MERSLPPLVEGDIQSTLIVSISEIIWINTQSNVYEAGSYHVSFLWWGDETPCECFPVNIKQGAVEPIVERTKLIFHVRTSWSLFLAYLKSTSPLVLTISSVENGTVLGKY